MIKKAELPEKFHFWGGMATKDSNDNFAFVIFFYPLTDKHGIIDKANFNMFY